MTLFSMPKCPSIVMDSPRVFCSAGSCLLTCLIFDGWSSGHGDDALRPAESSPINTLPKKDKVAFACRPPRLNLSSPPPLRLQLRQGNNMKKSD
ncbi:hypothetical protein BJX76DRAFT_39304 [Aspergillus varians]